MWKSLADSMSAASDWANSKINGESSTAEYYNPIGQEETNTTDRKDYAEPGFESRHVAEARLDRFVDIGINMTDKALGGNVASRTANMITGGPGGQQSYVPKSFSNNDNFNQTHSNNMNNNNMDFPRQNSYPNANTNSNSFPKTTKQELATDLSNQKQPDQSRSNFGAPTKRPGEMTFVFHSDLQDTEERVSHDWNLDPRHRLDEINYEITINGELVSRRDQFPKLISLEIFLQNSRSYINYGDLLEFAAHERKSHWVVYLGLDPVSNVDSCIHFCKRSRSISVKPLASVAKDKPIRRVNGVYNYEPKPAEQIKSAVEKIKQSISSNPEMVNKMFSSFNNSECFAGWLRYQSDNFLKVKTGEPAVLKVRYTDGFIEETKLSNLAGCVDKVRLLQKEGNQNLIRDRNKTKDLLMF